GRVHALEEVRDPPDARLDDDEAQARGARADAAEDELGDELAHAERRECDEGLADAGGGIEEPLEVHAARALDVEGERDAPRRDLGPEGLPHGVAVVGPALVVGEGLHLHAARAFREHPAKLGERFVERVDRDHRDAAQAPPARPLELEEPVVVACDAPAAQLGAVVPHRPAAVEHVDRDAVLVHVGEAGLRVPGARAHLLVDDARTVVLVVATSHEGEALDGLRLSVHHPHVALRRRLDARHAVREVSGRVSQPEIGRRIHVGVGGDQPLGHGGRLPCAPTADKTESLTIVRTRSAVLTRGDAPGQHGPNIGWSGGQDFTLGTVSARGRRAPPAAMHRMLVELKLARSALLVGLLFASRAAGAPTYVVTDLGTLGGPTSAAWGINGVGQVAGSASTADGAQHAFLYGEGVMLDVGTLGGTTSLAFGVNDAGQVVGAAATARNLASHAFLYSAGIMTDLGTLGGQTSVGQAINAAGQVAGSAEIGTNMLHAFLFSGGVMTDLGTFGGTASFGYGINRAGDVVGAA